MATWRLLPPPAAALALAACALSGSEPQPAQNPQGLVAALRSPDPRVRAAAMEGLDRPGPHTPSQVSALVAALGDADPYLRGAASLALGRIGAPAVAALARALGDPEVARRRSAAIALGRVGHPALAALAGLRDALADPDAQVRHAAAVAVGGLGTPAEATAPALVKLLADREEEVRAAAAQALRSVDPQGRTAALGREALAATLDRLVPELMSELKVPGVAVALVLDGRLAWSRGYGVRKAGGPEAVSAGTVFEAASMSKPVFALLALQLAEQGRLDLDRPLADYGGEPHLPGLPGRNRITARMALSHTSGLPNWRPGGEELEGPVPLLFEPGSRFNYSGEGFFLLQRTLERITGQPLDRWAEARIFKPLGLAATGFAWTPALGSRQATGHGDGGRPLPRSRYVHPNAAYTLYTTAEDYARILVEVLRAERGGSTLVSRASVQAALARQVRLDARPPIERPGEARGTEVYWGLGWSLNATGRGDIAHHGGSNRTGFRCFSQFSPTRGSGLVILTNGSQGGDLWTRVVASIGDL